MVGRKDILAAIRVLRKDIMTPRNGAPSVSRLLHRCEQIDKVPFSGQGWGSSDMTDPIAPEEHGHSVFIVTLPKNRGRVISLTGKKILGYVSNIKDETAVARQLTELTGAKHWKRRGNI